MKSTCSYCKKIFSPKRKDMLYCSASCKQMNYMQRKLSGNGLNKKASIETNNLHAPILNPSIDVSLQNVNPSINDSQNDNFLRSDTRQLMVQKVNPSIDDSKNDNFFQGDIPQFTVQKVNPSIDDSKNDNSFHCDTPQLTVQNVNPSNSQIYKAVGELNSLIEIGNNNEQNKENSKDISKQPAPQNVNTNGQHLPLTSLNQAKESTYTKIESQWLIELHARYRERENEHKFYRGQRTFGEKWAFVYWVSIRYRSFLEAFLTVSELKKVKTDDLIDLTNVLISITKTFSFRQLPGNYPYTKEIIDLRNRLNSLCREHQNEEFVPHRLKFSTKQELMLHRVELAYVFPSMPFNELEENLKQQLEKEVIEPLKETKQKQGEKKK